MVRPRLTKPDPNRQHPHPREASARETLRRHIALVKAILLIMIVGTIVWAVTFVAAFAFFKFYMGYNMQNQAFLGLFLIFITFYPARLACLVFLPVTY